MFLYLITNPHSHLSGIYYLSVSTMREETGLPLDEMFDKIMFALYDRPNSIVFVKKMLFYQARGEKAHRAAARQLVTLHRSPLIGTFIETYPIVQRYLTPTELHTLSDTLSLPHQIGYLPQKQDQNQKQDQEQEEEEREKDTLGQGVEKEKEALFDLRVEQITADQVQAMWNAYPQLKPLKALTGPIRQRITRQIILHPSGEWWQKYIQRIVASPFLTGDIDGSQGRRPFHATLDWVLGPQNMAKILAGNYDPDPPQKSPVQRLRERFLGREKRHDSR